MVLNATGRFPAQVAWEEPEAFAEQEAGSEPLHAEMDALEKQEGTPEPLYGDLQEQAEPHTPEAADVVPDAQEREAGETAGLETQADFPALAAGRIAGGC
jgi:hypothetical protein